MRNGFVWIGAAAALTTLTTGCSPTAQRDQFIRMMDAQPSEKRVPDWENTKRLVLREAPQVGQPAPDFTLKTRDGAQDITAAHQWRERPLVLVFGSFT